MTTLHDFYQAKLVRPTPSGFNVEPHDTNERLFPWQREIVQRALRLGRSALFADTGMGKTLMSLEWARHVAAHDGKPVLIVCPLAVAHQFQEEAWSLNMTVPYIREQEQVGDKAIYVTNYDALASKEQWNFEPERWAGVVLDEASVLKAYSGATKQMLIEMWRNTPYKLAQTATPSPNDLTEILNIAEWLGIMESGQALTRWFKRDTTKANKLRLKGHSHADFYRWLSSWATALTRPSDIGNYSDDGYILPPLHLHQYMVEIDYTLYQRREGTLVPNGKYSSTQMHMDKRTTFDQRVAKAVELANSHDRPCVVWASTIAESKSLVKSIRGAVEVEGAQSIREKELRILGFSRGDYRVMITKPSIAAMGVNWQHCADMVFASIDFSFESRYQAIRRCYRFGQRNEVNIHIITTESESNIQQAIAEKERAHRQLIQEIVKAQALNGVRDVSARLGLEDYHATVPLVLPVWLKEREV